jgi:CDP-diacylglycerol--serine O-phosphatidyltransferase
MLIPRSFIPSLFTVLNAFCGFMSIILASNNDFTGASLFIIYAMLFDAVDGFVARLLHSSSEFGVELDSLSDVISFGAAPSYLLYTLYFKSLDGIGILISSLIMVFSALRLARFNVQLEGFDKDTFKGVPTPMSAAIVCCYVIFYHDKLFSSEVSNIVIFIIAIGLPVLMVSRFKYDAMPKFSKRAILKSPVKYIIILAAVILVVATAGKGSLYVFLFYILTGIFRSIRALFTKGSHKHEGLTEEELVNLEKVSRR